MLNFSRSLLSLNQQGLHFGNDNMLAKTNTNGRIDIDSAMPRIVRMLKAAYNGGIPDYIPQRVEGALQSWNLGQQGIAITKLTQIYLPDPFIDPDAPSRLAKADEDPDDGVTVNIIHSLPPGLEGHPHLLITPNIPSDVNDGENEDEDETSDSGDDGHDVSDEPRIPAGQTGGGQWTSDSSSTTASAGGKNTKIDPIVVEKQTFVRQHLKDAQHVADAMHVPVENVLGLAALESRWGNGPFAVDGNNYFSMHYPAPLATGYRKAKKGNAKVALYSSQADSYRSFLQMNQTIAQGISDPKKFALILQQKGKFGIGDHGKPVVEYADDVENTARKLRPFIYRNKE